jgi:uncharacterized Ntn-hydrolase superfamily protein
LDLRAAVRVQFDISGFRICNAGVVRFQDSLSTVSQVCRYPEGGSIPRLLRRALLSLVLILAIHPSAFATWSILAVDTATGQIVVASATCLPQSVFPRIGAKDLRDIQAVVVPGKGAAVCQAAIETTRRNQQTVFAELGKGTDPVRILELLKSQDSAVESRQFGILDLQGRSIGFSGRGNQATSLSASGKVGASIHYQMQGNILAGDAVIHDAASAFDRAAGMLSDRVMAAMEAADARGGDRRCTDGRTAMVAYLLVVDKSGKETYISATDEDSKNPITALRARYEKAVPGLR